MEGDVVQLQELMRFKRLSVQEDGRIVGEFRATGIRPLFLDELSTMGLALKSEYFDPSKVL